MEYIANAVVAPGLFTWLYLLFEVICVTLTFLFLGFCCIPSFHTHARQILRPWAIYHVEKGLYWVALLQQYRTPILTTLMEHSSHSVSVGFYGSFLPILIWQGFSHLGTDLCFLMALALYAGNAMKDLVSSPRPLGLKYGEVRLSHLSTSSEETQKNAKEYGLPSSHTMNSLCFNFYVCHYLHRQGFLSDASAFSAYSTVTLWVCWIAISRLYLGLHTPIDILAGAVAGLTVLTAFISLQERIDQVLYSSNSWVLVGLLCLLLLRLHPTPERHTPSYEFTTSFMGVAFGIVIAINMLPGYYMQDEKAAMINTFSIPLYLQLIKVLLGFCIVLASKAIMKQVCLRVLPVVYTFFPLHIRRLWQPPVSTPIDNLTGLKKSANCDKFEWADVDTTTRFFTYVSIGFSTCYIVPKYVILFI